MSTIDREAAIKAIRAAAKESPYRRTSREFAGEILDALAPHFETEAQQQPSEPEPAEGTWVFGWVTAGGVRYRAQQYQGPAGWHRPRETFRASWYGGNSTDLRCGEKVAATFEPGEWTEARKDQPEVTYVTGTVEVGRTRYQAIRFSDGEVRRAARRYSEDAMELLCGPNVASTFVEGEW